MKSWVLERQRRRGGKLLQCQTGLSKVKPSGSIHVHGASQHQNTVPWVFHLH